MLVPPESNLPAGKHFTDVAPPGHAVILQQPKHQIAGLVGDIVATRYKLRGIPALVVDGRMRDVVGIHDLCADGALVCWSGGLTSVGTSLEGKVWGVDVPLRIGKVRRSTSFFLFLQPAD